MAKQSSFIRCFKFVFDDKQIICESLDELYSAINHWNKKFKRFRHPGFEVQTAYYTRSQLNDMIEFED